MRGQTPASKVKAPVIKPTASIFLTTKTATWKNMDDVREACKGKPVKITGTTLDLQDCQIVGTKLKFYGDNDERNEPLRVNIPKFVMKKGSVRKMPGGIVFRKEAQRYESLVFLEIGEDALSNIMDDSPDAVIKRCKFYGASDKSLQLNDARGVTVEYCEFNGGITGVRLQKKGGKYKKPRTKLIRNNTFNDCDTAWHLAGGVQVVASGNKYNGVNTRVVKNDGSFQGS
jgi:Right handed beta helix region